MLKADFAWQFPFDELTVYIEADGTTCYAYVGTQDGRIYNFYGEVWLFNLGEAPESLPWKEGKEPPFENPRSFARAFDLATTVGPEDFEVNCLLVGTRYVYRINCHHRFIGLIWDGASPGCSAFALIDGPVANRIPDDLEDPANYL